MVATLGPEAWPAPPLEELARRIAQPRHLHPMLRDQRVIAGIGRSWVDEVLWEAALSPFRQGSELEDEEVERLHEAMHVLGDAIDHYEEVIGDVVPDKLPMPLQVHRREGEPCPRCGATLAAVHFAEHVPPTARTSRRAGASSRTAAFPGSSNRAGRLAILKLRCRDSCRGDSKYRKEFPMRLRLLTLLGGAALIGALVVASVALAGGNPANKLFANLTGGQVVGGQGAPAGTGNARSRCGRRSRRSASGSRTRRSGRRRA